MKIFLSFLQSNKNHPIPGYSFWQYYIKNGIEEAGHEWVECPDIDWALGIVPKSDAEQAQWSADAWQKTLNWFKGNYADLFLSYLYPQQVNAQAIGQIQKAGIPCVNFFCDNVREYTSIPAAFKCFDLNWVPEFEALALYKKAGYKYSHLPMPIWVEPHLRTPREEVYPQITFIGSRDVQRQLLLEEIVKNAPGLPLKIYGSGWADEGAEQSTPILSPGQKLLNQVMFISRHGIQPYLRKINQRGNAAALSDQLKEHKGKKLSFDEYISFTAQSAVTVGINRYPSYQYPLHAPNVYSRLRDIEAPMLGACYLTEWAPGIDDMYDTRKEISTYTGSADFIDRSNQLLRDKTQRTTLRLQGQKRALSSHSIPVTLNAIKCALGL